MEHEEYSEAAWERMMANYDYEVAASEFDAGQQLEQIQRIRQQQTDGFQADDLNWCWDPQAHEEDHAFSIHRHYEAATIQQETSFEPAGHGEPTVNSPAHDNQSTYVPTQPDLCEQLLHLIKNGSLHDRMAALTTLKEDFCTLDTFLARTEGVHELLDLLALDAMEQEVTCDLVQINSSSKADQLDWKGTVWELLMLILYNLEPLFLDIQDIREVAILPVLALVQKEKDARYRRMALRFLLAEPIRCAECQDAIVDSGGMALLVNALAIERDEEALELLLELLRQIATVSPSYKQAVNLTVQDIVNSNDASEIEFTNLLLLVHQEQAPTFTPSTTEADRKQQLGQFLLQASTNTLYVANSSLLHKYIALNCVRKALPEIGFAFVFDHDGIPLLWDLLMQSESGTLNALAVDILRWLAHEDDAFRDHIIDFYTEYAAVQEMETQLKAAAIRCEVLGERTKRKRSNTDSTEEWIELPSEISEMLSIPETDQCDAQADETASDADSDCGEFRYGSTASDSDMEDLEPASDAVVDTMAHDDIGKSIDLCFKETCSSDDDWEIVSDGEC